MTNPGGKSVVLKEYLVTIIIICFDLYVFMFVVFLSNKQKFVRNKSFNLNTLNGDEKEKEWNDGKY